ncbi:MAG: hypothetical protein EX269_10955 [Acidimicrobiales bacterium]|nr:MAG: hypothetical protein EX269_10955 [Acidimicrobiales bacterium]
MPSARQLIAVLLGLVSAGLLFGAPRVTQLPQDPLAWGLGPGVTTPTLVVFAIVSIVGVVMTLLWPRLAMVAFGLVGTGIGILVLVEFRSSVLLLAIPALAAAVVLAVRVDRRVLIVSVISIALVTAIAGGITRWTYLEKYGATHPESSAIGIDGPADWMWVGGVTSTAATIAAGELDEGDRTLHYRNDSGATGFVTTTPGPYGVARFELSDLDPGTSYHYRIDEGDEVTFRTPQTGAQDLTVVLGSCARSGSNGAIFDAMLGEDPDLFLNLGDLHYANLVSDDPADHIAAIGRSLSTPAQSALVSSVPTAWVWDDHDYGDDDSDSSSPSREAVSVAYRRAVPHFGVDTDPAEPISQAFTIGRVRFVVTDTRSQRTSASMLGERQLEWFLDEIGVSAQTHAAVVWMNPAPWLSHRGPGSDQWGGFPDERRRIADAIAAAEIDNLVVVSGDYHMVAIDDGTNTGFASDGSPGFPLLHAGPLDRPAAAIGGPFSHGTYETAGQYGKLEIEDDGGDTVQIRLSGHTWEGDEFVALELDFDVPAGA